MRMRSVCSTLLVTLALAATGCQKFAESLVQAGIDEIFENAGGNRRTDTVSPDDFAPAQSLAFMTGTDSDNVFCFVPWAGSWDLITTYDSGERPIGITSAGDAGLIVTTGAGVRKGGSMFVPLEELTVATGAAEIGLIAAAADREVVVAATTATGASILVRLDARSGTVLGATAPRPATAVAGLTVVGDLAVVAEAPLGDIVCYDLTQATPERIVLVDGAATSGQPAGMTVGPDGTLLVASADDAVVQEFDLETGIELDRFRIAAAGLGGLRDIEFDPARGNYLVTAGGDALYELDETGTLLGVHVQSGLAGAASITIVRP